MRGWSKTAVLAAGFAAALSFAGCGGRQAAGPTLEDDMFLAAALSHTDSQIAVAHLAIQKAHTPAIIAYAKSVADERSGLDQRLAAAAKTAGTGTDTNMVPRLDTLDQLQGTAFERAFVAAELEDQQNNLDSFVFESENGTDPELRSLATAEIPRLRQDFAQAGAIVKDIPFESEGEQNGDVVPVH
jgi:putative membrane protein